MLYGLPRWPAPGAVPSNGWPPQTLSHAMTRRQTGFSVRRPPDPDCLNLRSFRVHMTDDVDGMDRTSRQRSDRVRWPFSGVRRASQYLSMMTSPLASSPSASSRQPFTTSSAGGSGLPALFQGSSASKRILLARYLAWCAGRGLDPLSCPRPLCSCTRGCRRSVGSGLPVSAVLGRRRFYRPALLTGVLGTSPPSMCRPAPSSAESPTLGFPPSQFQSPGCLNAGRGESAIRAISRCCHAVLLGLRTSRPPDAETYQIAISAKNTELPPGPCTCSRQGHQDRPVR